MKKMHDKQNNPDKIKELEEAKLRLMAMYEDPKPNEDTKHKK